MYSKTSCQNPKFLRYNTASLQIHITIKHISTSCTNQVCVLLYAKTTLNNAVTVTM